MIHQQQSCRKKQSKTIRETLLAIYVHVPLSWFSLATFVILVVAAVTPKPTGETFVIPSTSHIYVLIIKEIIKKN